MVKNHRLAAKDPLAGYFHLLVKNKGQPKQALQLIRIYQEYTFNNSSVLVLDTPTSEINSEPIDIISSQEINPWSTNMANHKE